MKISRRQFEKQMEELNIMFNGKNYRGTIDVQEVKQEGTNNSKAMVTIKTEAFVYEVHKQNAYLYGAILKCDNFSLEAENNTLIMKFGFEIA